MFKTKERFCFRLVLQENEKIGFSFYAHSEEEKREWVVDIEEAIRLRDKADEFRF